MVVHAEIPPIEIAAPPERVREVLLDFKNLRSWHNGHFKSITVPSGKDAKDLVKGDKLEVVLDHGKEGIKFSPVILENSATRFRWKGSMPGVFAGDHFFEFLPSETNPGWTKFVQYEDFSGLISFTMKPEKRSGQMNLEGFAALNNDLKRKVETGA